MRGYGSGKNGTSSKSRRSNLFYDIIKFYIEASNNDAD